MTKLQKVLPIKRVRQEKTRHYTEVEKIRVVAICTSGLSMAKCSEMTDIPVDTIKWWRKQPWWYDCVQQIHKEEDEEINTNFSRIVKKAQVQVEERLEKGDWVLIKTKVGAYQERIPVKARDLSTIVTQSLDKRQLLLDRPTSRTEKISVKERLSNLAEEFKKFSQAKEIIVEATEVPSEKA